MEQTLEERIAANVRPCGRAEATKRASQLARVYGAANVHVRETSDYDYLARWPGGRRDAERVGYALACSGYAGYARRGTTVYIYAEHTRACGRTCRAAAMQARAARGLISAEAVAMA